MVVVLAIGLVISLVILHEALKKQQEATPTNKVVSGEKLLIAPDSYIDVTFDPSVQHLHLYNPGSTTTVVNKVEVVGVTSTSVDYTVRPSEGTKLEIPVNGTIVPGTNYLVKVYTRFGNVYSCTLLAR